jgi:heme O synthase-like polyprenyltransferase
MYLANFFLNSTRTKISNALNFIFSQALVVLTTMGGYVMAPGNFIPLTFLLASVGTTLTSTSANAINQVLY